MKFNGGTVNDLGSLNTSLAGNTGSFTFNDKTWHDFYATSPIIQGELGYNISDALKAYARLGYVWDSSKVVQAGDASIPALSASTLPVLAKLGDYDAWLLSVGGRYTFGSGAWKPYIGADVGAAFVDSIDASFSIPGAGITAARTNLYDSTTAFTGGVELGLMYDVSPAVSVGGSVGYRYIDGLDANPDGLAALGMTNQDAGHRASVPITFNVAAKF